MALNFKFPDVGEGIHEGKLVKWLVKEGDEVKEDQAIVEIETDKAVVEIPSPQKGFVLKLYFKEGEVINVGQTLVTIGQKGEPIPAEEKPAVKPMPSSTIKLPVSPIPPTQTAASSIGILATPSVRQRARELGVDLNLVKGSGPGGRISVEDVESAAKGGAKHVSAASAASKPEPSFQMDFAQFGPIEKVQLTGIRKRIAEVMARSKRTAAHVTHFDEVDVTALAERREREKKIGEQKGLKITYMPFIVKAVVAALKAFPKFNASFDEGREEIILKKYYNIGIAIDTPEGLIVPVLHEADKKDIYQIAAEIMRLAQEALDRKMKLDDLRGGTFTITNIGSIGGEYFTPIIYHPEVAILGIGRIGDKVIVKEGKTAIRKMLPLSLSFDHRVVDGAEAARFVNEIKRMLENPESIK